MPNLPSSLPPGFWEEEYRRLAVLIVPRLAQMALEGSRRGSEKIGIGFNNHIYNILAEEWARSYTDILLREVGTTNQMVVGDILAKWIATPGSTVGDLRAALSPYFGVRWADMIAVTETTRAFAAGELMAYQNAGIEEFVWGTNKDELVCPLCGAVNGVKKKIGEPFGFFRWRRGHPPEPVYAPPYHPNCRCGISPVVVLRRVFNMATFHGDKIVKNVLAMIPPAFVHYERMDSHV